MNEFSVDKTHDRREMIAEVLAEVEPHHSGGASSERYFFNGKVYKLPASKKSLFTPKEVEQNIAILSESKVDFADTILGVYNLSEAGKWSETPVIIQREADLTFKESLSSKKEATDDTWNLLRRAIDLADRAIESEIVLDGSLTNFGLYGNQVLFLDVQDGNSVGKYTVEKYRDMYESLANSMSLAGADKNTVLDIIEKNSKFFAR